MQLVFEYVNYIIDSNKLYHLLRVLLHLTADEEFPSASGLENPVLSEALKLELPLYAVASTDDFTSRDPDPIARPQYLYATAGGFTESLPKTAERSSAYYDKAPIRKNFFTTIYKYAIYGNVVDLRIERFNLGLPSISGLGTINSSSYGFSRGHTLVSCFDCSRLIQQRRKGPKSQARDAGISQRYGV